MTDTALVLATTNPGKAAEFRVLLKPLLAGLSVCVVTPMELGLTLDPIAETGQTFAENARLKALALATATGRPALADDSGLCVDALDGAPGLYSARWAGEGLSDSERTAFLLEKLAGVPIGARAARFVCAAAVAHPAGEVIVAEGVCHGVISERPQGTYGFGYDPIFYLPALSVTMAQLPTGRKNRFSHRAQALGLLAPHIRALFIPV